MRVVRLGLSVIASFMRIGVQFENILTRGLLGYALRQPNGSPLFRYLYHESIEESHHSLMFQEFLNRSGVDADMLIGWRGVVGHAAVRSDDGRDGQHAGLAHARSAADSGQVRCGCGGQRR